MEHEPDTDMSDRRLWHIGKEVPLAIILAIGIQTFGVVWWFANLSSKVDYIQQQVANLTASTVTAADARGKDELQTLRNLEQDRRIQLLEKEVRDLILFQRHNGGRRQ